MKHCRIVIGTRGTELRANNANTKNVESKKLEAFPLRRLAVKILTAGEWEKKSYSTTDARMY